MAEISRRYIDKYWVVPVRKLFYFHHWWRLLVGKVVGACRIAGFAKHQ